MIFTVSQKCWGKTPQRNPCSILAVQYPCPYTSLHAREPQRTGPFRAASSSVPNRRLGQLRTNGPQPFVRDARDPWADPRPPGIRKIQFLLINVGFVWRNIRRIFGALFGDHFARVESSRDQNPTMFTLDFHNLLHLLPPTKVMKIHTFPKPFKSRMPGTMPR